MPNPPSVALVLGAGGLLGTAYHAGVVAALDEVLGFDAREADLIVGTSAGANTAATLRSGLSPADHHARATDRPVSDQAAAILERATVEVDLSDASFVGWGMPSSARLLVGGIRPLRRGRPVVSLAGALPRGEGSLDAMTRRLNDLHVERWPDAPTWICCVSMASSERAVFGRDDLPETDIGTAVAASSAVPGTFAPIRIGDTEYIDGGVHSTTNADLVGGLGFDVVIVSAPMATDIAQPSYRAHGLSRTWHTRTVRQETERFPRRSRTAVLAPSAALIETIGSNNMSHERVVEVAEQARVETATVLSGPRFERIRDRFAS